MRSAADTSIPVPPAPPTAVETPSRRKADRITVFLFVAAIWLPLIGTFLHWNPGGERGENRALAAMPHRPGDLTELENYPGAFLDWFDDHFGFRNELIGLNAKARYDALGGTANKTVTIGKDGWFFLRSDKDHLGFRGLNPFPPAELDQWQRIFQERQKWLAARGIVYLLMIPPDKQTIYPEFMPDYLQRGTGPTRLDQLIARLKGVGIPVVDVREPLLAMKDQEILFLKTDTHWNDAGALIGCQALLRTIGQLLPNRTVPLVDELGVEPVFITEPGGDLAGLMGLKDSIRERHVVLLPRKPRLVKEGGTVYGGQIIAGSGDAHEATMVMIRDSFANAMVPLMADRFRRAVYLSEDGFNARAIEQEHPDIVVTEIVERKLYLPPVENPPLVVEGVDVDAR